MKPGSPVAESSSHCPRSKAPIGPGPGPAWDTALWVAASGAHALQPVPVIPPQYISAMSIHSQTIYGETIEDLLPALVAFAEAAHLDADGMCRASVTLAPKEGLPFQKAMMRAEAALMLGDAERIGSLNYEDRSYEQRACDAFIRLVEATGED